LLILLVLSGRARGQTPGQRPRATAPASTRPAPISPDSARIRTDTLRRSAATPADTLKVPLGRRAGKRDIETTITYTARDSIRLDAPGKTAYLYGDAHIVYGTTNLEAELVKIEYGQNLVTAEGAPDSTGKLVGTPIFTDKGEQYEAKKIAYNFKSKKGKISEAITKQGEGYVHAEAVKRNADNELYGLHGQYTTCDLANPHYYIAASKMKVVPGEKIVSGPFNLVIAGIPTPLGFLFGYFPTPKSRSSGILIPSYGESTSRGFYLINGGYYWAASRHVGVKLTGDFYTLGGWAARTDVQYRKLYKFDGSVQLSYLRAQPGQQLGLGTDLNPSSIARSADQIRINWQHRPVTRPGTGTFSASVDAGSSGFYRGQVNTTVQNILTPTFNSTISYQKVVPNSPFSYTVSLRQSQSGGTGTALPRMDFTLPDVSFGMQQQTPLHWLALKTGRRVFNNLTVSYQLAASHQFSTLRTRSNVPGLTNVVGLQTRDRALTLKNDGLGTILRNGNTSVNHTINLGLGTYTVKHINFSPGVSYGERWTFRKFNYTYVPDSQGVRVDTTRGLYRVYTYTYSLNATTRLYGMLNLPKTWKVQAVRTVINPSVSYGYSPDYGGAQFGYYQEGIRTDSTGTLRTLPRYAGVPGGGKSSVISFGLNSQIEAKLRAAADDTTGKPRKVMLINQMSINSSYNLLADSLRLSPFTASLSTRLFGLIDIGLNGIQLSPYQRDTAGRAINRYLVDGPGFRLLRLQSANLNIAFSFNSEQRKLPASQRQLPPNAAPLGAAQGSADLVGQTMVPGMDVLPDYVIFTLPWTLTMQFGINYVAPPPRGPAAGQRVLQTGTLTTNGTVKLTPKWALTYAAPFDFRTLKLVTPSLGIVRDLHCWEMSAYWIPTGTYQSYRVSIGVRSSMLRDLKLDRNRSWYNR
jgi:lipopolysaccharide export system protein LptA